MSNEPMDKCWKSGAMSDAQRWSLREPVGTGYNIHEGVFQFAVRGVRFVWTSRTLWMPLKAGDNSFGLPFGRCQFKKISSSVIQGDA